jgi:hypothetical protein
MKNTAAIAIATMPFICAVMAFIARFFGVGYRDTKQRQNELAGASPRKESVKNMRLSLIHI